MTLTGTCHGAQVHISAWMGGSCGTSQRLATLGAWTWAAVKLTMRVRHSAQPLRGPSLRSILGEGACGVRLTMRVRCAATGACVARLLGGKAQGERVGSL